jgi:hypothetical protein
VIIESLVRNYPSHGFVIDREELQELGLPARDLSGEEGGIIERMDPELRAPSVLLSYCHGIPRTGTRG